MGKSFSFQSSLILFWLLFFITVKFCSAHFASSATRQPFPENEGKPKKENLVNKGSLNHIEEDKFKSIIKKLLYKKPFIQVPPGISQKPSIPTFEVKPPVQMVKRPNFLLIPFLKNLFPIMNNKPQLQRPTLKPIPFVKTPKKFLPFPKFVRPIPKPIPIIKKPFSGYEKLIPKPFPAIQKPIPKFVSQPIRAIKRPISKFEKPISETIPAMERPILAFEKPISEAIPTMKKPFPVFEKPISEELPAVEKPFPEFKESISEPIPTMEKSFSEFEEPISEPIPAMEKPFPKFEEPILEPIPSMQKPFPEFEEPISEPIPPMDKQIPSAQKIITNNEKSMPISKKDFLLPQLTHTKIPFPPKFKKPLPAHKPNPIP
ncbi:hypothetical protein QN277_002107 [Acacia crassicarpa]|uniref:Periaxin n=1 Tax=Acacia crassicarpa TaxID=499986 RepID=A0AAE1THJ9_9FABA|nr:hypothetical protein QN277_002107 [Acacia crassicarpa]